MDQSPPHTTAIRVRYAETDQMGVVYHANYYVWMEIGRVELVRSRGLNYKELEASEGLLLAVVETNCRYKRPARYDQEIVVETRIAEITPRTVEFAYQIKCAETGSLLAEGGTKHVWLGRDWKPKRLPEKFRRMLSD